MSRILSRRADGAPPPTDAHPAEAPDAVVPARSAGEEVSAAEVATAPDAALDRAPPAPGSEQPTAVQPVVEAAAPGEPDPAAEPDPGLPAGAEPAPAGTPSFRSRGRLRRRLRYLRRVREIGFRDLGGLVFDLDRFGRERPDLVALKLEGLRAIDAELRALEESLGDVRAVEELEEPGISACGRCGALHGSEARFCPACGTSVDAPASAAELPGAAPADAAPAKAVPADPPAADPPATDPPPAEPPAADAPTVIEPPADRTGTDQPSA